MSSSSRKVAVITGAATGVGRATAIQFAKQGFHIAVNYSRSEKEAAETVNQIKMYGVETLMHACDISDNSAVQQMFQQIHQHFGQINVLVNNAGTTFFVDHQDLDEMTEEKWDRILAVNVKGTFFCIRSAIPFLKQSDNSAIVNVSSCAGISGGGSCIAYAASKAAVNALTKSFARSLAPKIRVNAVCPGPIDTRWVADHTEHVTKSLSITPMNRTSTADDIADTIMYLAIGTTMTTGQCLVVDGGRTV
ncbi:MAG: SDR family oxidoreductase [Planctomycetes bacterium]|nr:SDR family oxidoreductase [Planctomycetota bacterium]